MRPPGRLAPEKEGAADKRIREGAQNLRIRAFSGAKISSIIVDPVDSHSFGIMAQNTS